MPRRRSLPIPMKGLIRPHGASTPLRGEALAPGLKVGLFGGSFDPPHGGHVHVAETAMRRLGLDRVWWLVSPQNPLKSRRPDGLNSRLDAVRAYIDRPGMVVSDVEARLSIQYTAILVRSLTRRYPGVNFVWIMGADNLASIHRWQDWHDIIESVPIAVISRPQDPVRARFSLMATRYRHARICEYEAKKLPLQIAPAWTYLIEPLQSDSSTQLRNHR